MALSGGGWRIPLYVKVLASYLVLLALVFIPAFLHLRGVFHDEIRQARLQELEKGCDVLAGRLADAPEDRFREIVQVAIAATTARITIVDAQGRVLGDSFANAETLENHADRPEIKRALAEGSGTAERMSATTKETRLYAARRFPSAGTPQGVVRLSIATREIDDALDRSFRFFGRTGAVALSAAVLFGLLAALFISRPLERIAKVARSLGEGDLGGRVDVRSNDELQDVADALRDLAANLRGTLLSAGADRATLQALVDDLPCGVIIYDAKREPHLVGGSARELCGLSGADDFDRARRIAELPAQAEAIGRALQDRKTVVTDLELPWLAKATLEARWVGCYGPNGEPQPALIVRDKDPEERVRRMRVALKRSSELLRKGARAIADRVLAAELESAADNGEGTSTSSPATGDIVMESIELGTLCEDAVSDLRARLAESGLRIELDLGEPHVRILEVDGRGHTAVRRLLQGALGAANGTNLLRIRGEVGESKVRLSIRTEGKKIRVGGLAELVHCLGGDAGFERDGDAHEAWLTLPRA
jgi:PAS domain-containing protein